jgi:Toprim domain
VSYPIAELRRRLADRADDIAARVLCDLRRDGREIEGRGVRTGIKYKIALAGRKRGFVLDCSAPFERGAARHGGGNLFNLVTTELAAGDTRAGIDRAMQLLGLAPDSAPVRRDYAAERRAEAARQDAARQDAARRRGKALAIWRSCQTLAPGAPAWAYLAGRSCAVASDALRAGIVRHPDGGDLPALVACVIEPAGGFLGVHVTYLAEHAGVWRKAPVAGVKRSFGPIGGGVIPLTRGASGRPIARAVGETLLLAEGIENALCAWQELPQLRCWAAVSIGNLASVAIPAGFRVIRLVRDRDGDNPRAVVPVTALRERITAQWRREGRMVLWADVAGHKDVAAWRASRRAG